MYSTGIADGVLYRSAKKRASACRIALEESMMRVQRNWMAQDAFRIIKIIIDAMINPMLVSFLCTMYLTGM